MGLVPLRTVLGRDRDVLDAPGSEGPTVTDQLRNRHLAVPPATGDEDRRLTADGLPDWATNGTGLNVRKDIQATMPNALPLLFELLLVIAGGLQEVLDGSALRGDR